MGLIQNFSVIPAPPAHATVARDEFARDSPLQRRVLCEPNSPNRGAENIAERWPTLDPGLLGRHGCTSESRRPPHRDRAARRKQARRGQSFPAASNPHRASPTSKIADLRDIEVGTERKGDGELQITIGGRLTVHIEHVLDAVDFLLERRRYRIADDFGGSAGITRADDNRRRCDFWILGDREGEIGRPAKSE